MTRVLHFLGIGRLPKRPMVEATGGLERVALEIARIQARRGVKVTVASMAPTAWSGTWEGVSLRHRASHFQSAGIVAASVGLVALGAGGILVLTSTSARSTVAVVVAPTGLTGAVAW